MAETESRMSTDGTFALPIRQAKQTGKSLPGLPSNTLAKIKQKLSPEDAANLSMTCKTIYHKLVSKPQKRLALLDLPPEILLEITDKLSPSDMFHLSQTCKSLHGMLIGELYRNVMVTYAEDLQVTSGLASWTKTYFIDGQSSEMINIAPFIRNLGISAANHRHMELERNPNGDSLIHRINKHIENAFLRIPENSLRSFSWHLGCCAPAKLFGAEGWIPTQQSRITKFAISLEHHWDDASVDDLKKLGNLRHLAWEGVSAPDYLVEMMLANRDHLEKLDISFIPRGYCPWGATKCLMSKTGLFTVGPNNPFRSLRHVSMSNSLISSVVQDDGFAFPLDQLQTLRINNSRDIRAFLHAAGYWFETINLRAVEITFTGVVTSLWEWGYASQHGILEHISEFAHLSRGLEELYVSVVDLEESCQSFVPSIMKHHRRTLKRLVFHGYQDNNFHRQNCLYHWMGNGDGSTGTCHLENLECLGLTVLPVDMALCIHICAPKPRWKFLHFRITAQYHEPRNLLFNLCKAGLPKAYFPPSIRGILEECRFNISTAVFESCMHLADNASDRTRRESLMDMAVFLRFAAWVFGPNGFPHLQILALGDFTKPANSWSQVVLCRQPRPRGVQPALCFRVMHPEDEHLWDNIEKSREVLYACIPNDSAHEGNGRYGFDHFKGWEC